MIKVSPSILSADFMNMGRDLQTIKDVGADYIHVDIMDGHFVPNLSMGIPMVTAAKKVSDLVLDVHLMIEKPIRYAERFCQAGADILTIHTESDTEKNTLEALQMIKQAGVRPAICVKPKTPAEAVLPFINHVDLILVMTVEPGFGGQSFMADMMPKLRQIRQYIDEMNPNCELEVDGGINTETAKICVENGANVLVAGNAFFKANDKAGFVRSLKAL